MEPARILAPRASDAPVRRTAPAAVTAIDRVWSGTRVGFAGLVRDAGAVIAYYDRERHLTVAHLDLASGHLRRTRLASRFGGWDSHNAVALASAPDGSLHLAANMHASPLVYARASGPADTAAFQLASTTGRDDAETTYPTFVGGGATAPLCFVYRSGRAGAGTWLADGWDGAAWTRLGTLFSDRSRDGPVSAYPTPFARDRIGGLHVAVVWRRTRDVETNFAITYGRTQDFRSWTGRDGVARPAPLGIDDAEPIEAPGPGAGLLNNARLVLDRHDRPIVLYTRYAPDGRSALIAARPGPGGWTVREVVRAGRRTALGGPGSLAATPRFGVRGPDRDRARISVHFPGEDPIFLVLDIATLVAVPTTRFAVPARTPEDPAEFDGLADPVANAAIVTDADEPARVRGRLTWVTQAPNRDRPRSADRGTQAPPPTTLRFHPLP